MKRPSKTPVTLVALITALSLLGDSMLYIVLPLYWKEAGLDSIWQVGILLSINRFIRMPFNPLVGWLYHRISLRTGLIIAVTLGTITTIGYGLASSFIVWVILRSLWGIAWSFFRIGGLSTVVLYSQEGNRGQSMGVYNGLYRTGSLGGCSLGTACPPVRNADDCHPVWLSVIGRHPLGAVLLGPHQPWGRGTIKLAGNDDLVPQYPFRHCKWLHRDLAIPGSLRLHHQLPLGISIRG
ncbi:MFS transporter [Rossellomorea sp. H39__3]